MPGISSQENSQKEAELPRASNLVWNEEVAARVEKKYQELISTEPLAGQIRRAEESVVLNAEDFSPRMNTVG